VKPDITNITRYSARPFTKAKSMEGRIKTEIAKQRSKILTDLCKEISYKKNINYIGKFYKALITESGKNQTFIGRTDYYKPVVIKETVRIGDYVKLKIVDVKSTYFVGSII
jgi:tRNA A37 methylthiotransferase MiaB